MVNKTKIEHDEGPVEMMLHNEKGIVFVNFEKPVMGLGLDPASALRMANALIEHSEKANNYVRNKAWQNEKG